MKRIQLLSGLALLCVLSGSAFAQLTPYDTPTLECESSGLSSITLRVCAGASGAPAGVSIQWTTLEDYYQYGWNGPSYCALSLSGQPSMQHPGASRWDLGPNECETLTIGDINFDETGVSGDACASEPLQCGTEYVFRVFAHAGRGFGRSAFSCTNDIDFCTICSTQTCDNGGGCTFTQGFWKTHGPAGCQTGQNSNEWPVAGLTLGSVAYTDAELCSILNKPAGGNGLISLAHQLIAAKLNVANGAANCTNVAAAIAAADALIGNLVVPPVGSGSLSPGTTSTLNTKLDQYNNGVLDGCPAHCASETKPGTESSNWGSMKTIYR